MIRIIDNYNILPLGKYVQIQEICEKGGDDIDVQVKILSILSNMPEDEILHLPLPEYKEMVLASKFLETFDHNKHQIAKKYVLGDLELIPVTDYRRLETSQYVDFQTFASESKTKMVEFLSVLLVPKGHRYNEGYDIADVQNAIREHLYVTEAISLYAFFLILFRNLIKDSLNSSKKALKEMKNNPQLKKKLLQEVKELEMALWQSGDGSQM